MVYDLYCKLKAGAVAACFLFFLCTGCSKKENTEKTYYIEILNCNYDSFRLNLSQQIFGKVSFYKNKKLEILSMNYVTENIPGMHYFRSSETLNKDIPEQTNKIRITCKGNFDLDSITYSLQKYKYHNNGWVKISDMGDFRETKSFVQPQNIINEYVNRIIINTVQYTYE